MQRQYTDQLKNLRYKADLKNVQKLAKSLDIYFFTLKRYVTKNGQMSNKRQKRVGHFSYLDFLRYKVDLKNVQTGLTAKAVWTFIFSQCKAKLRKTSKMAKFPIPKGIGGRIVQNSPTYLMSFFHQAISPPGG